MNVKKIILKKLKSFFSPIAARLGFYSKGSNEDGKTFLLSQSLSYLKENGFSPKYILDVGANHGTWTRDVITIFPEANFILIEPQAQLEKSIEDLKESFKVRFFSIGLGNENCIREFSINESDDSSSFNRSKTNLKGYDFIGSKMIQMRKLDSFLNEENIPIPDLVKIDAEGLDMEVLEGASSIFGITQVIFLEASIHQKTFPNSLIRVMNYMDQKGYELFDFTDLNRPFSNGLLWLVEVMFVKKGSSFGK
ncbi:FkbM family methyltransferase [Algoriphagus boseongensis]|uniref:FkbM family methyltransferase n=1 Tax=Algoriphagus boseongensis TaxID=1442587 RepID=A0A4R6TCX4_9BACT|nr:FkbM family methyltransferase [Algoriphagus boseongensis]TDQ19585.1 FkbM family methyltransferase [Algoriphagus boseongensis]